VSRIIKVYRSHFEDKARYSPVEANGNLKFLVFLARELHVRIAVAAAAAAVVYTDVGIIVVGVIRMNNVEIIL
jgi:hypothetical protein